MGKFILKHIDMTLDARSIDKAIREIRKLQTDLKDAMRGLVEELAKQGAEIAKIEITDLGAVDTGALRASIGYGAFDPATRTAIVYAGGYYACFVEFGTGVVGQQNPPPALDSMQDFAVMGENGALYTEYDTNKHGEAGWWYRPVGGTRYRWTKGMPARPFMYNTYVNLGDIAKHHGGQILAQYIP